MPTCRPVFLWILALTPVAVPADELPPRLTVATWNLEWFFDNDTGDNASELAKKLSPPNADAWRWRVESVAAAIARMRPDILALQEVENQRVLFELCTRLKEDHQLIYRDAIIQGRDFHTEQDVAFLWRSGLVEYARKVPSREEWDDPRYYSIPKFLIGRFEWGAGPQAERLTVVNVHLRAMPENEKQRLQQVRLLRRWFDAQIRGGENVIILGDINTEEKFTDTAPDREVGVLRGLNTTDEADDLVDLHRFVPAGKRYTHLIFREFDRILVTPSLLSDAPDRRDLVFQSARVRYDVAVRGERQDPDHWDIYYDIPQPERDLSDHYPVVAEFEVR